LLCGLPEIDGEVKLGFNGDLYPTAGATSVMSTTGDIVRYDSERERYGIGATNQVLTVVGGLPAWASATGGATVSKVQTSLAATFSTTSTVYTDVTDWTLTKPDITGGICFGLASATPYTTGTAINQGFQLMDNDVSVAQSIVRQNEQGGSPHAMNMVMDLSDSDGNVLHVEMKISSGSGSIYYSTTWGIPKLVAFGVG